MNKIFEKTEEKICSDYRSWIIEMVKKIEDPVILMKIYTVAKTHLRILREKEHKD